jgi:GT2 family glycosyltransferase
MFISVIICTYRRPAPLRALLDCLAREPGADFEVLVVDGDGENPAAAELVGGLQAGHQAWRALRWLPSPPGLTRQRNLGLRAARGEAVCFLDDDVTFAPGFLAGVSALLEADGRAAIAGLTAYDTRNYGAPVSLRQRVYRAAGLFTSLTPGSLGRCGLQVPLAIQAPFHGCREVAWLPGFCMIYRRAAVEGLQFDEALPTYGGEDADFSAAAGRRGRLVLAGDLAVRHEQSPEARVASARGWWEVNYGLARRHLARAGRLAGLPVLVWYALVEFAIDLLALLRHPSRLRLSVLLAKPAGLLSGARSLGARSPAARERAV